MYVHVSDDCRSLEDIDHENQLPTVKEPGSTIQLVFPDITNCDTESNVSYLLEYQNYSNEEPQIIRKYQGYSRTRTLLIYMNTSGLYCVNRGCTIQAQATQKRCCVKVTGN